VKAKTRPLALGFEYQHRFYWIQACRLFNGARNVASVAIEQPRIKAFDDVVTTYRKPITDAFGRSIIADHFQLKFHLTRRETIRAADLIAPEFIGATSVSLLERVRDAVADGEIPRRLTLVSCWDIDTTDPLGELVSNRQGEFEVDRLLGAGPQTKIGRVREAWRAALGNIEDVYLARILRHLRFQVHHRIEDLDELLERDLQIAGLVPIDPTLATHPYVAISQRFILDGTCEHDAESLDAVLRREHLRTGESMRTRQGDKSLAIKSFSQFAVELEDAADTLNLLPFFRGRQTAEEVEWDRDVVPRVRAFLLERIHPGESYVLYLDTHLSLTYLAGIVLGKLPATVSPARAGRIWRVGPLPEPAPWTCSEEPIGEGAELGIAIEASRAIGADVRSYLREAVPAVGRLLTLCVPGGVSERSVIDAEHAFALARGVAVTLQRLRSEQERGRPLHLFIAAPAAFVFFLGREARAFGPTTTYEYDLENGAPTAYTPALHIQLSTLGGSK